LEVDSGGESLKQKKPGNPLPKGGSVGSIKKSIG
jgi:hypothetical protein